MRPIRWASLFARKASRSGVATDLGYMPVSVRDHLRGCDVLVMESNHDLEMLRVGPYPWSVKQRVMSRVGHLSNVALADFFTNDYDNSAAFVVLAHLSEQNNHPEIARREAEKALAARRRLVSKPCAAGVADRGAGADSAVAWGTVLWHLSYP